MSDAGGAEDVFLPPPEPPRKVLLECPPQLDKAGRTELHAVFRTHMPYLSTRAIMPASNSGGRGGRGGGGTSGGRGGFGDDGVRRDDNDRTVVQSPAAGAVAAATDSTFFEVSHELSKKSSRQSWPKERGEYLEFSVYKAGRSTHEVAESLCRCLDIKRGRYCFVVCLCVCVCI